MFLILISSCEHSQVFGVKEDCTILGDSGICTDERTKNPPKDCIRYNDMDDTYVCKSDYFIGYKATSLKDYASLVETIDKLILENAKLKKDLETCDGL